MTAGQSRDLPVERVRVAVIGGGPSGLTAAAALAGHVDGEVRVIEREDVAGGIPRHSDHLGYGVRDLRRVRLGSGVRAPAHRDGTRRRRADPHPGAGHRLDR